MIEAERLSKRYGDLLAVDDVSFTVEQGEVVGFLGPNGAGKTTTMRILTGFLPPTDGTARIAGVPDWDDSPLLETDLTRLPGAQIGIILPARVSSRDAAVSLSGAPRAEQGEH